MGKKNWTVFGICLVTLLSSACSSNPSSATDASGNSTSVAAAATTTTTTTTGVGPTILMFSPASASVTSLPTVVQVDFSESNMSSSAVDSIYDWSYVCGGETFYPTSVSLSGSIATVELPTVSGLPSGDACVLTASSSIVDGSGYALSGMMSATYTLGTSTSTSTATITVSPASETVGYAQDVSFTASGGYAPYTYTVVSGEGYMSGSTYIAPSTAGSATIEVRDSEGNTAFASLTISQTGTTTTASNAPTYVLSGFSMTPENTHVVGGYGCPSGYGNTGQVADCGDNRKYGDQEFCLDYVSSASVESASGSVISDIQITPGGNHIVGGEPCPYGYIQVGEVADCQNDFGNCAGDQNVCVLYEPISTATVFVTYFYITPEGQHIVGGPGCESGYSVEGNMADCGGGGTCYGNQLLCVKYAY